VAAIAVIFDFDDTLIPDSTTELLEAYRIDATKFWADAQKLVLLGYDATPAFLKLLLDNIGRGKKFGQLTNQKLYEFGATLDSKFFPGIPELFGSLRQEVEKHRDTQVEFYIISGGLKPVIEGTRLGREGLATGIYASELAGDTDSGPLKYIKRCVTFTEKTRYLFEINKGISPADARRNPYRVNAAVRISKRRVPFRNMIYVGDGLTDIPCFSLLRNADRRGKGAAFGVFDPKRKDPKRAFREFLKSERVSSLHFPRYTENDELGTLLRAAVANRAVELALERAEADDNGD
jgi:phosphoglycolate phosphatase-like HAD superfamily hydrolase